MAYIKYIKKGGKYDTQIDPVLLDTEIDKVKLGYFDKEKQITILRQEHSILGEELRNLEFIRTQLK